MWSKTVGLSVQVCLEKILEGFAGHPAFKSGVVPDLNA